MSDLVNLNNHGREVQLNTPKGSYIAYGPLEEGRDKFDVKTPTGGTVQMNLKEFFRLMINNAPSLERTPGQDTFSPAN